jgi:hypothetical protein
LPARIAGGLGSGQAGLALDQVAVAVVLVPILPE